MSFRDGHSSEAPVELLLGRYDGMAQTALPNDTKMVVTEVNPFTRVPTFSLYTRSDEGHFIYNTCYELA